MTWEEFKQWVEQQGVKADDDLWYIDVEMAGNTPSAAQFDEDLGWATRDRAEPTGGALES